jgi:hypothetical protein
VRPAPSAARTLASPTLYHSWGQKPVVSNLKLNHVPRFMNGTNQLDKELAELKGFIADLKEDRASQKEKEKRESWTKYTSMSLVFIAVLAAVATQWAGKYSSRTLVELNNSTFYQAEASDQWSYYQAKSIKQNLYESLREIAPRESANDSNAATQALAAFKAKVEKYEQDKAEIKKGAEALEQKRDAARAAPTRASEHGGGMGTAISLFQIAIALGSICLVTKKRYLWYLALLFSAVAAVQMVHVWMK